MKAIDIWACGIKCDNPNCDFRDMSVRFEDYPKWLNRPCPKCGQNLLTEADLRTTKRAMHMAKIINFILRNKKLNPDNRVAGEIEMNGTGKMKIKLQ